MAHELFSNIIDAARDSFRHLSNASIETIAAAVAVVVIVAFFLMKR